MASKADLTMPPPQTKPIVLVIGANQGIGFHAVQQLVATNKYTVLLGARDLSKGTRAAQEILSRATAISIDPSTLVPIQIDTTSDASITSAATLIEARYGRLDVLINNAGIGRAPASDAAPTLRAQYAALFGTNSFAPVVAAHAFLPLLRKSDLKRIVFTSSGLGLNSFALPGTPYPAHLFPVYRASKAALNMSVLSLAQQLEDEGFAVCAVDPGHVKTALSNCTGSKEPAEGAQVLLWAVEERDASAVHRKLMKVEGGVRGYWDW